MKKWILIFLALSMLFSTGCSKRTLTDKEYDEMSFEFSHQLEKNTEALIWALPNGNDDTKRLISESETCIDLAKHVIPPKIHEKSFKTFMQQVNAFDNAIKSAKDCIDYTEDGEYLQAKEAKSYFCSCRQDALEYIRSKTRQEIEEHEAEKHLK